MAIDINTIKKMSPKARLGVVFLVLALIGYFYWFFFLNAAMEKRTTLSTQLTELQDKIKEKEKIAKQIGKFKADVAALQESYKIALQKLPDQREIPALFHSVSAAGRDAGVEFVLFEPRASVPRTFEASAPPKASALMKPSDQRAEQPAAAPAGKPAAAAAPEPFYEEIPVGVTILGSYQEILFFFDKVAKLPRIVNVSDVAISKTADSKSRKNLLSSTCTIKTYMFIDKKEKK